MSKLDINRHVKLAEILKAFPQVEDVLQNLSPVYKNLKNPILRKTVLKIATLEKVAQIGGLDVYYLVNTLRNEVGQPPITPEPEPSKAQQEPSLSQSPEWIKGDPAQIIDGVAMLNRGEHPLGLVLQVISGLPADQYIVLKTNFKPLPLIEKMQEAGYKVHHEMDKKNPEMHLTFIGK